MDYQKKTCPYCLANLPHAEHTTALEMAQQGVRLVDVEDGETPAVFIGLHAVERKKEQAA